MLFLLMVQLQRFSRMLLALMMAPFGLPGIVAAMLPTGTPMGFVALLGLIALARMIIRNAVILISEVDNHSRRGVARQYANLIVLRTFSKAYGLAGLRIGYAVASAETAGLLHKVKVPPNVNHLAQIAASAALDDNDFLARSVTLVRDGLADYYACCEALGFDYIPSFANFLIINLERDGDEAAKVFLDAGIVRRLGREVGLPS